MSGYSRADREGILRSFNEDLDRDNDPQPIISATSTSQMNPTFYPPATPPIAPTELSSKNAADLSNIQPATLNASEPAAPVSIQTAGTELSEQENQALKIAAFCDIAGCDPGFARNFLDVSAT